ncbi:MAG: NADH-quinone oxidoreductase subunit NuoK [Planctomycetaceae bacterium]
MNVMLDNYLVVGAILFVIGALGFLTRRNLIIIMLSAEMMLHGVSLNLVAFSKRHGNFEGQAFTAFILTVAACEAGLALALVLALYQRRKSLDISLWRNLGDELPEPGETTAPAEDVIPEPQEFPRLTPAGRVPQVPKQETVGRV